MIPFAAPDESIWVGVLRLQFRVAGARSIKDKRKVVNQLRDRLSTRHRVSVAEVGWLEEHTRGVVAVSMVGNDAQHVRSSLDGLVHRVNESMVALVEDASVAVMRPWSDAPETGF